MFWFLWQMALVERLATSSRRGGSSNWEIVRALSINDPNGVITCRWFEPVWHRGARVRIEGGLAFRLTLASHCTKESTLCAIRYVEMQYSEQHKLYFLPSEEGIELEAWLEAKRQEGASAGTSVAQGGDS